MINSDIKKSYHRRSRKTSLTILCSLASQVDLSYFYIVAVNKTLYIYMVKKDFKKVKSNLKSFFYDYDD